MGRKSGDAYDRKLGLRESETSVADSFVAEFPVVVGRTVTLVSEGESPDRIMLVDGVETGVELTAIHADGAEQIIEEILRLAHQKDESFARRDLYAARPMILLGHLDWPAPEIEGAALYDVHEELSELVYPDDFAQFGFAEIWLMDDGPKYSSRRDSRAPADFFCFSPKDTLGFWQRERKRRPYREIFRGDW